MNRKITYYIVIGLLLFTSKLQAQEHHPFPVKNTVWAEYFHPQGGYYPNVYHYFALKDNDTIIKKNQYQKLYLSYDTIFTEDKFCGGLREENKKVYYYSVAPLNCTNRPVPVDTEIILYDFNLKLGDTITRDEFRIRIPGILIVLKIDSMIVGDQYRKVYSFGDTLGNLLSGAQWVEGIGCLSGLLADIGYSFNNDLGSNLICFIQEDEVLFHNYLPECYNSNNPIAVQLLKNESQIKIIPNPAFSRVQIEFDNLDYKNLIISDRSGKKLKEYDLKGKSFLVINKEELSNGLYLISVYDNAGNVQTLKLLFE